MKKFYLDSAIWRDYYENRSDRFRPLGEWALELIIKIKANEDQVLYSDLVFDELVRYFDKEKVKEILKIISDEGLLEKAEIKKEHFEEASRLHKRFSIPFGDCLHAVIARDNDAVMVTRDRHFEELQGLVEIKKPEELI